MDQLIKFHHLGLACNDLVREKLYLKNIGYYPVSDQIEDKLMNVVVQFFESKVQKSPAIEIIKPLDHSKDPNFIQNILKKGIKIYHMAYLCKNIQTGIEKFKTEKAKLILSPQPAIAFMGKRVCFLTLRNGLLVELIEKNN